jgi:hypothetical protein
MYSKYNSVFVVIIIITVVFVII